MTITHSDPASVISRGARKQKAATVSPRVRRKAARALTALPPPEPLVQPAREPVVRTPATGKLGLMVALMRRQGGATMADLMEATGWQAHSVRGALAGSLKRTRGYEIASGKVDGVRVYTMAPEPTPEPVPA
jgi:hypothetical protein